MFSIKNVRQIYNLESDNVWEILNKSVNVLRMWEPFEPLQLQFAELLDFSLFLKLLTNFTHVIM